MALEIRSGHLVVAEVRPGSPAAVAGLLPGDTIIAIDDLSLIEVLVLAHVDRAAVHPRQKRRVLAALGILMLCDGGNRDQERERGQNRQSFH